jgi:hypothetical protein
VEAWVNGNEELIRQRLQDLAQQQARRFGSRRLGVLLRQELWAINYP